MQRENEALEALLAQDPRDAQDGDNAALEFLQNQEVRNIGAGDAAGVQPQPEEDDGNMDFLDEMFGPENNHEADVGEVEEDQSDEEGEDDDGGDGAGAGDAVAVNEEGQGLAAEHQAMIHAAPGGGYQTFNRPKYFPLRVRIIILRLYVTSYQCS